MGFSLIIRTDGTKKGRSSCFWVPDGGWVASGQIYRWFATEKQTKRKRKTKSPSTVARYRARKQRFCKQKKSAKTSHLNARQQQTENTVYTEQDYSSAETADTDLTESNCDLDELIAQKHFENTFAQEGRYCANCKGSGKETGLKCCTGCKFLRYCSKECQAGQWITNKPLCKAIQSLLMLQ